MCVMMLKSDMCRFMLLEKILNLLNLFAPTSFLKNLKFQHSPVGPPFRASLCHLLSFAVQATSLALCACFHGSTFSLPCRVRQDRQVAVANEAPVDSARSIFTLRTTTTTTTTTTLTTATTTTTTIVVTLIVFTTTGTTIIAVLLLLLLLLFSFPLSASCSHSRSGLIVVIDLSLVLLLVGFTFGVSPPAPTPTPAILTTTTATTTLH